MIGLCFLYALLITCIYLPMCKVYQLEGYKIKKTLQKVLTFKFAFGNKNKLIFTKRMIRFVSAIFVTTLFISLITYIFSKSILLILLLHLAFFICFFVIFTFVHFIMCPIENMIKCLFIHKAKSKLNNFKCKKIGITGSFGKTTTKNILYEILKQEFNVCVTPKSYNTPMGVCKTILENLKEDDEFFIVEMGARHKGDIAYLTKFVDVDYGIITSIGNQHIETFGSLENIEDTKFELCEFLKNDGLVVFNGKSESTKRLYKRCERNKYLVCKKGSYAYPSNICTDENGSKFTFNIDGKKIDFSTKLLGSLNIDNIVSASSLAYLLGENLFNIKKGVENLNPIPHRLELIKGENVYVIDDSYNSNLSGATEALCVLNSFKRRKIVITPGIVEMGKIQDEINFKLGEGIAKVADICIIMNETNKKSIKNGLISKKFDENCIFFAKTREEQKNILNSILMKNDIILFENDLPDNYR